jgi:hypothetical protein
VIGTVLALTAASAVAGATAKPTVAADSPIVTADLDKTTLAWLKSHEHRHYPVRWKEGVECHVPLLIRSRSGFSCIVFFDKPGLVIPLVEGSAHVKVRSLRRAHGGYNISLDITASVHRYTAPHVAAPPATTTLPPATTSAPPTTAPPPPTTAPPPPTTAPPPTTSPPRPVSSQNCSVSLSNAAPADYSDETASIQSNVPNSALMLTKQYKTTTSSDSGMTDANGNATVEFYISGATPGYTVTVTVTVGNAQCSTSFTPS